MSQKIGSVFAACMLLAIAVPLSLNADVWNKKTVLTVNEPINIPGKTLQPGKYVVKLADSLSNRHIVQFIERTRE